MEGMMLSFPRPKPLLSLSLASPPPLLRIAATSIPILAGEAQNRHSCACRRTTVVVPSIWHAITPSLGCAAASKASLRRRLRGLSAEEGSWNAAWDARPARWLHGSDSAWLLFGVCSCYCPVGMVGVDEAVVEVGTEARDVVVVEAKPADDYKLIGEYFSHPELLFVGVDEAVVEVGTEAGDVVVVEAKPADDYKLIGMSADGRCLFRAVAYGACLATGKEAPDETQQKKLADDLRAHVVDELIKRRNEIERFIEEDFDKYIERIRQPYIWGGEPELLMASHVLRLPLSVYMIDGSSSRLINIANYGEEYKDKDISIKVLFHGYGHYDALEIATEVK